MVSPVADGSQFSLISAKSIQYLLRKPVPFGGNLAWSADAISGFRNAAESLKLFRRADLTDPEHNTSLIDELYEDPLPEDAVFRNLLRPSTTFVIGRKGTGKSTVFQ